MNAAASQVALVVKTRLAMQETQETHVDPWFGKIPWRRAWQPSPVVLPGESHGQRNMEAGGLQSMGSQSQTLLRQLSTLI